MVTFNRGQVQPDRLVIAAYVLVSVVYVALRIFVFAPAANIEFPDSVSFIEKAVSPLNAEFFLGEGRFFSVPLLYKVTNKLFGPGLSALTMVQLVISIGAWLAFAWSLASVLATARLGFAGFVAALTLSLSLDILQWDRAILSESISTSAFVFFLAAWLQLGERGSNWRVEALLIPSTLFAVTREANGLMLLPFAVILLAWAIWYVRERRRRLVYFAVAGWWVLLTVVGTAVAGHGERWLFPLLNVIGKRVLTTPERLAFYEGYGMPVNERLLGMKGEFASGQDWAFYRDTELEAFRRWTRANGRSVFALDLTFHPARTLAEPLVNLGDMLCPDLAVYRPAGAKAILPNLGQLRSCTPAATRVSLFGSLTLGVVLAILAGALRHRVSASVGFRLLTIATMLLGWPPFLWFTWHVIGDMEIGRHALAGTIQFRLAVLLLAGYTAMAVRQKFFPVAERVAT